MLIPNSIAKWMEECGVPISENTISTGAGFTSVSPIMERIVKNGTLLYSFLWYLGQKARSKDMIELLNLVKLSPGDSHFVIVDNWAQLFPVLSRMGIEKSQDERKKILSGGLLKLIFVFV